MLKLSSVLLTLLLASLCLHPAYAQDLQDIGSVFSDNPDSAFYLATHGRIDTDLFLAGYERFLKVVGVINYPKLTDEQFAKYVKPLIGTEVKTPIQQISSITRHDTAKTTICTYDMPMANGKVLHYDVRSFTLLVDAENDQLVFEGKLAAVEKAPDGYRVRIEPAKATVVAGDDIISSYEQQQLLNALNTEDYQSVAERTAEYMSRFYLDPDGRQALLRFMHLFAITGMTSRGQMTYEDLGKELDGLEGQPVAIPAREFSSKEYGGLNRVTLKGDTASIAFTDTGGTHIHMFVYAKLMERPTELPKDGERVQMFGVIESLEPNPNKSHVWVLRMTLGKAEMRPLRQE